MPSGVHRICARPHLTANTEYSGPCCARLFDPDAFSVPQFGGGGERLSLVANGLRRMHQPKLYSALHAIAAESQWLPLPPSCLDLRTRSTDTCNPPTRPPFICVVDLDEVQTGDMPHCVFQITIATQWVCVYVMTIELTVPALLNDHFLRVECPSPATMLPRLVSSANGRLNGLFRKFERTALGRPDRLVPHFM